MAYSQMLRELFPEISLQAEDLLLLETFQIKYLPDRVAKIDFAALLREYPIVHRFLVNKHPPIESFLTELLEENEAVNNPAQNEDFCQEALWEIADLIIYHKHPESYDSMDRIHWNVEEITSITPLTGKTLADVGAGSGRIAFLLAPFAQTVFAVEPIDSLRSFMKVKADNQKTNNLFVMDGTLDSIPLPDNSLDVLITSNAMGWRLNEELIEIERVVKPKGYAIHLIFADSEQEDPHRETLTSAPWNYKYMQYLTEKALRIKYYKICQ